MVEGLEFGRECNWAESWGSPKAWKMVARLEICWVMERGFPRLG
jgi:hypothetical protein